MECGRNGKKKEEAWLGHALALGRASAGSRNRMGPVNSETEKDEEEQTLWRMSAYKSVTQCCAFGRGSLIVWDS